MCFFRFDVNFFFMFFSVYMLFKVGEGHLSTKSFDWLFATILTWSGDVDWRTFTCTLSVLIHECRWEEMEEKTSGLKMSVWAGALGSNWAKLTGLIFDESEKLIMPVIDVFVCNFLNGWSGHESISIEEMLWLTCRRELVEVFEKNHTGYCCWLKVVWICWLNLGVDRFVWLI